MTKLMMFCAGLNAMMAALALYLGDYALAAFNGACCGVCFVCSSNK